MINKPIVMEIDENTYAINEFGLDTMFIIVGKSSALVIDTGMGCFDFKALIESITDLPYKVVLTHGHLDHLGGIDQFTEVYLHPNDLYKIDSASKIEREKSCLRLYGLEGDKDVWDFSLVNPREWENRPTIIPLEDGMEFDLGDHKIVAIFTPGHSKGGMCFLDKKSRILFSGDECNQNILVTDCSVETELNSMLHLKQYESYFDRNFNGHLGFSSGLTHISMPKSTLDDIIIACQRIIDGKANPVSLSKSPRYPNEMVATYLYGAISLTYRINLIYQKDEK